MSPGLLKGIGVGCCVLCALLLFVAWERYSSNAKAVEAANRMIQSAPFGGDSPFPNMMKQMTGSSKIEPGVPAATTYSLIFAALSGIGAIVCFVAAAQKGPPQSIAPSA